MATTIDNQAADRPADVSTSAVVELLRGPSDIGEHGFAIIYGHYQPTLVRYAAARGARDPEGVANLALFDGYKALNSLQSREEWSFRSYLFRATSNHVVAEYRRADAIPADLHEDLLVGEDIADQEVERLWLKDLVAELPPDQRDVIESRFFLGLSGIETSQRLGKNANAVHQLQHRALRRLLRRITFAGVALLIAVAGIWAASRTLGSTIEVDSSPADSAEDSAPVNDQDRPAVAPVRDGADSDDPAIGAPSRGQGDDITIEAGPAETSGSDASVDTPAVEAPEVDAVSQEPGADGAGPEPTSDPDPAPEAVQEPPVVAGVDPPQVEPSPAAQAATRPNLCAVHQINPSLYTLKLYNPQSNPANAETFVAPLALRLLDSGGTVIDTIDTSGAMANSAAPGSHGWIGEAPSTYAAYADAPPPTYWGELTDSPAMSTWASIQLLDPASGVWTPIAACNQP